VILVKTLIEIADVLVAALFLAGANERLVGYFDPLWKRIQVENLKQYVSFVTGFGLSFLFQIDLVSEIISAQPLVPWAGTFLTALIIGGGSNLIHDLWPQ